MTNSLGTAKDFRSLQGCQMVETRVAVCRISADFPMILGERFQPGPCQPGISVAKTSLSPFSSKRKLLRIRLLTHLSQGNCTSKSLASQVHPSKAAVYLYTFVIPSSVGTWNAQLLLVHLGSLGQHALHESSKGSRTSRHRGRRET